MVVEESGEPAHRFAGYRYSAERRDLVDRDGGHVTLRPQSLAVFRVLAAHAGTVVDRDTFFREVWGDVHVTEDSLGKCVGEIRRAIGDTAHETLQTVPRQGYLLLADPPDETPPPHPRARPRRSLVTGVVAGAVVLGAFALLSSEDDPEEVASTPVARTSGSGSAPGASGENGVASMSRTANPDGPVSYRTGGADVPGVEGAAVATDAPSLALGIDAPEAAEAEAARIASRLREALSRYRTVRVSTAAATDLELRLTLFPEDSDEGRLGVELAAPASDTLLFAESFDLASMADRRLLGARIAAMVASPGGGHVARYLIASSREQPPETLDAATCHAYAYDCTNCSGELDSVDKRAEACLARLLREEPDAAATWALQSTIFTHQYQWGTNLSEPAYSDLDARAHLPALAIDSATHAEQLSDGKDSSVYWGMAQAYGASCEIDKMRTAIRRGLAINPDDPNLLGTFGNWLAYAGEWDEGVALVERALEIEPRLYRPWWLFAPAKRHYSRGEYEQAYEVFVEAFNERNWLSHVQLAYTLPHLDRLEEARRSLARAENLMPGITIEFVVQLYSTYCFPEDYIARMVAGLEMAGMPTRGDYSDVRHPEVPHSKVLTIGDWDVEYMDLGTGTPVVFVHGAMSDYRTWAHYQNAVSAQRRYLSYSRRYHGSQPWTDDGEKAGPANAGKDLGDFLDALDLERVFLVGWSSGADPILHLALERPELVAGIVIYEPVIDTVAEEFDEDFPRAARDRFVAKFGRVGAHLEAGRDEAATRAFLETVFEYPVGGFDRELMAIRRVVLDNVRTVPLRFSKWSSTLTCADIGGVVAPTLIVGGGETQAFWQYLSRKFAECIPGARFTVLDGVRHDGPIRDPSALHALIDEFVARHEPERAAR